jgi:hypothetical protein
MPRTDYTCTLCGGCFSTWAAAEKCENTHPEIDSEDLVVAKTADCEFINRVGVPTKIKLSIHKRTATKDINGHVWYEIVKDAETREVIVSAMLEAQNG